MLILTRKIGETILIGDNIPVMIVQVLGKQVLLGIEAPPELLVLRTEKRLDPEKKQKSQAPEIVLPTNALGGY
jgi:carbon storage regulator